MSMRNRQGLYSEAPARPPSSTIQHHTIVMEYGETVEKLPSDLLEEIATFFPLASLCWFRAVSKKWNRFISHPDFASRHARATSPEEYVLISEEDIDLEFSSGGSWVVLDVASKRSFISSAHFLTEFVEQEEIIAPCPRGRLWSSNRRTMLATDGGLLCLSYYVNHGGSIIFCELGTHEALLVCNPVLKTVKQLSFRTLQDGRKDLNGL